MRFMRRDIISRNPLTDRAHRSRSARAADVRALTLASGAGRIAIGIALALAPRQALTALGFSDHSAATVAIARIAGGRDIAMGAVTLMAGDDADRLGQASLANAAVDAGDALAFSAALASGEDVGGAAARGISAALPAAIAGVWVASRVGALPGRDRT